MDFNKLFGSTVTHTFDCMEKAENEIATFKKKYPDKKEELHRSFGLLYPLKGMAELSECVYLHHCRQILTWVVKDHEVGVTDAQVITALFSTSLPPEYSPAYYLLFKEVYDGAQSKELLAIKFSDKELEFGKKFIEFLRKKLQDVPHAPNTI